MNERIRELADEAAKFSAIMALPTGESGDKLFVKKFAELIVRECGIVADHWVNDEDNGRNLVSERLKQHFGVES